jgi:excisionase family DNA binding protein
MNLPANGSARIQVPEICQRLELSERAVYALLEAQIIPSLRLRKRWLIGRHTYMQWEENIGKRDAIALHNATAVH